MNGQTGLRFVFKNGAYLNVAVSEAQANKIFNDWISGTSPASIGNIGGSSGPFCMTWGVSTSDISFLHIIDLQQLLAQSQESKKFGPSPLGLNRSGL